MVLTKFDTSSGIENKVQSYDHTWNLIYDNVALYDIGRKMNYSENSIFDYPLEKKLNNLLSLF